MPTRFGFILLWGVVGAVCAQIMGMLLVALFLPHGLPWEGHAGLALFGVLLGGFWAYTVLSNEQD